MQSIYETRKRIHTSISNTQMRLDPYGAMRLFQDMTEAHSADLGVDYFTMKEKSGAFWIITKIRIRFDRAPALFEDTLVRTWPAAAQRLACPRYYTISDGAGICVQARSEWVILDMQTRRPRRPESTCYPSDFAFCTDTLLDEPFLRLHPDFSAMEKCMTRRIESTDVDMSHHTNNCQYARFVLDCFPVSFWDEREIAGFELHFLSESREGEEISIFRSRQSDGRTLIAGADGEGRAVFAAVLTLRDVN